MKRTILLSLLLIVLTSGCVGQETGTTTTTTSIPIITTIPTTTTPTSTDKIKIASFNVQVFGKIKREKDDVMNIITKMAREFDVMLVMEIRDSSGDTAPYYLQKINENGNYGYVISDRLGRTSSKEQYAYLYNKDKVQFIDDYVYADVNDVFEREPYIATFRSGNFDFTLVGIHTKPEDATAEIGHLADVVHSVETKKPNEKDVIVMGDFNADGSYFNENDNTNPFKASEFHWVITNDMDTMTKTDYTYDRMVLTDYTYNYEFVKGSAKVFYFDSIYGISNKTLVTEVSDHYPIYGEFKTNLADDD